MTHKKRQILSALSDGTSKNLTLIGLECGQGYDRAASWASDAIKRLCRDGYVSYHKQRGAHITYKGLEALR